MSSTDDTNTLVTVNVKGPSGLKLTLEVNLEMTVLQMKEKIAQQNQDFPAERYVGHLRSYSSQRLIYSGKVLKDPETLQSYNLKDGRMYLDN